MKPKTLTLTAGAGATRISLSDALTFIGQEAIDAGEKRGEIQTRGPWNVITSYKALCITATWIDEGWAESVDEYTLHGDRVLSGVRQSGYELEGYVSIAGEKRSAFTSSILFEIEETGKLVKAAVIHARSSQP